MAFLQSIIPPACSTSETAISRQVKMSKWSCSSFQKVTLSTKKWATSGQLHWGWRQKKI